MLTVTLETGKMKKSLRNIDMVQFLVVFVLMLILVVPVQATPAAEQALVYSGTRRTGLTAPANLVSIRSVDPGKNHGENFLIHNPALSAGFFCFEHLEN